MKGMGKIGYVANSPYTIIGDSMSAGRIYDRIDDKAKAKVVMVTSSGVLCKLSKKKKNKKLLKELESEHKEDTIGSMINDINLMLNADANTTELTYLKKLQ